MPLEDSVEDGLVWVAVDMRVSVGGEKRATRQSRLSFQGLTLALGGQFSVLHAFELDAVRVEEEHRVVILVIVVGRVDDAHALALEKSLQGVDVLPVAQLEGVVVQADIADAIGPAALA